jgi:hypothetical protein
MQSTAEDRQLEYYNFVSFARYRILEFFSARATAIQELSCPEVIANNG